MDPSHLLEPETHVFTGVVTSWHNGIGELVTDSGIFVPLVVEGHPPIVEGTRITISAKKFRPIYQVLAVRRP